MVVKGPPSGQDIYDTPPSVDKSQLFSQQTVRGCCCTNRVSSLSVVIGEEGDSGRLFNPSVLYHLSLFAGYVGP